MSTPPYIPLFHEKYESATTHLSLAEDGAYNRLLRLCWVTPGCSVPADPAWIGRKMRASQEEFETIIKPILIEFFTLKDGRYFQAKLSREFLYAQGVQKARREAGKKGVAAKAQKHNNKALSKRTSKGQANLDHTYTTNTLTDSPLRSPQGGCAEIDIFGPAPEPEKRPRRKPATALPENFPGETERESAAAAAKLAGVTLDIGREAERFRNHAEANDRRLSSWPAGFRNWIATAIERAPKARPDINPNDYLTYQ